MPIPAIAAAVLSTLGSTLAKNGVEVLGDVLSTGTDAVKKAVSKTIEEKTGIKLEAAKDGKLTADQVSDLAEFERDNIPELLEYLKETERAHVQLAQIDAADRGDARQRQAEKTGALAWFLPLYITLITIASGAYLGYASFGTYIPSDNQEQVVSTVVGFLLGSVLGAILQYLVGSSVGSKSKQNQIDGIIRTKL